jgi:hypothetical protein
MDRSKGVKPTESKYQSREVEVKKSSSPFIQRNWFPRVEDESGVRGGSVNEQASKNV